MYYVRNNQGEVSGPYPKSVIREMAQSGTLLQSDHLSADQESWIRAGRAKGLEFPLQIEQEPSNQSPARTARTDHSEAQQEQLLRRRDTQAKPAETPKKNRGLIITLAASIGGIAALVVIAVVVYVGVRGGLPTQVSSLFAPPSHNTLSVHGPGRKDVIVRAIPEFVMEGDRKTITTRPAEGWQLELVRLPELPYFGWTEDGLPLGVMSVETGFSGIGGNATIGNDTPVYQKVNGIGMSWAFLVTPAGKQNADFWVFDMLRVRADPSKFIEFATSELPGKTLTPRQARRLIDIVEQTAMPIDPPLHKVIRSIADGTIDLVSAKVQSKRGPIQYLAIEPVDSDDDSTMPDIRFRSAILLWKDSGETDRDILLAALGPDTIHSFHSYFVLGETSNPWDLHLNPGLRNQQQSIWVEGLGLPMLRAWEAYETNPYSSSGRALNELAGYIFPNDEEEAFRAFDYTMNDFKGRDGGYGYISAFRSMLHSRFRNETTPLDDERVVELAQIVTNPTNRSSIAWGLVRTNKIEEGPLVDLLLSSIKAFYSPSEFERMWWIRQFIDEDRPDLAVRVLDASDFRTTISGDIDHKVRSAWEDILKWAFFSDDPDVFKKTSKHLEIDEESLNRQLNELLFLGGRVTENRYEKLRFVFLNQLNSGRDVSKLDLIYLSGSNNDLELIGATLDAPHVNKQRATAHFLYGASISGRIEVLRSFIEHGTEVDIDLQQEDTWHRRRPNSLRAREWSHTPLYYATWSGKQEAIDYLLEQGADPMLFAAAVPYLLNDKEQVDRFLALLFEYKMSPDHSPRGTRTLLTQSIHSNNTSAVLALLEAGADPFLADGFGETPIKLIEKHGNPRIDEAVQKAAAQK